MLSIALCTFTYACTDANTPSSSNSKSNSSEVTEPTVQTLSIAVIPYDDPEIQEDKLKRFEGYLEEELEIPVDFQITEDYETSIALLVEEKVQMAYLGPFSYVQAKSQNPDIEPIVAHIESASGRSWYTGVIVADTNQGIKTLEDLRGKRFGFTNQSSTSGYLVSSAQFKTIGLDPAKDFTAIEYAGSHDKNATALAEGKVDAVSIEEAQYLEAEKSGELPSDRYSVIWQSDPLPNSPLVISSKLPRPFKIQLQKALIEAPSGLGVVGGHAASGYTSVADEDYEAIRRIQGTLELD